MIELEKVCRSYGDTLAVDRLDLRVAPGQLYSLLGHNGAGKTTTIKMLVGLLRPGAGTIRVGGYDVVTETRQAVSLIGYVPDQPYLYEKLSGREFLKFVAQMHGLTAAESDRCVDREIERLELAEFVDVLVESYSHGMKQRTAIASAMLYSPRVLIVDEPLVGLDPHSVRVVKNLLRAEVDAGLCVLMSTHTLGAAEEISDRVGIMANGRLRFDGPIGELRRQVVDGQASLEAMYLSITEGEPPSALPVET